jgi:hypothetical protein
MATSHYLLPAEKLCNAMEFQSRCNLNLVSALKVSLSCPSFQVINHVTRKILQQNSPQLVRLLASKILIKHFGM